MSTERQDYSIEHQRLAVAAYAAKREYTITHTFADEGISGLGVEKRRGLRELLSSIVAGQAEFQVILVYDVSRWGRFQNPDQAAHYEFLCSEAGVRVEYCAEQFCNDGSISSVLLKNIKRVMAAEYSRELSDKVVRAQATLALKGYWQGGPAGYGLRRRQMQANGAAGRILESGEWKGVHDGRTTLVLGPPAEVATVREIFRLYIRQKMSFRAIAETLNAGGVPYLPGRIWRSASVKNILTNEKYAGVYVAQRLVRRLGAKPSRRPAAELIRAEGVFPAIVSAAAIKAVERRRQRFARRFTDAQMLEGLRELLTRHGHLNRHLIDGAPQIPNARAYHDRFGGLRPAYRLIGYEPPPRSNRSA